MCVGFPPDICALTSAGGFHCFLRAEGRGRTEERLQTTAPIGPERSPPLPLSPAHRHPAPPLHVRACAAAAKFFLFYFSKPCAAVIWKVERWQADRKLWIQGDR